MTTIPAPTWWQEQHDVLQQCAEEGETDAGPPFSAQLLDLLADVERAFAVTGADTPPWPDPHLGPDGEMLDVREEEYSRCLDPGKHRILAARAEAWAQVLTARGWAEREEVADGDALPWLVDPYAQTHRTTVLRPHRLGAQTLLLVRTAPDGETGSQDLAQSDAALPGILVGLGDPPLPAETLPDCGCDACDSGSRDLLEQLDRIVLSIVDGSYEVEVSPRGRRERSSFGGSAGSGADDPAVTAKITAGPWAPDWTSRPMGPMLEIDLEPDPWAEGALREPWPSRLFEAVSRTLPVPLVRRLHRRSARVTSRAYIALEADESREITVPLDALEHPPTGFHRLHRSAVLPGTDLDEAREALLRGDLHRRAGLRVAAQHTPLREGSEVHLRIGAGPLRITAPCRVLRVIDEPDRAGFAYGTLPGHPEAGIEEFVLSRSPTGLVRLDIDAVSRPATWYARLGAPLTRLVQARITRRYLRALR
jgi:uncharacterized protein (UPF0548 family)